MLKCNKCGKLKEESAFYVRTNRERGYSYACKHCHVKGNIDRLISEIKEQ